MGAMTSRCTRELANYNSLSYTRTKKCPHQPAELFPCPFVAEDLKVFPDPAGLKQRRDFPPGPPAPPVLMRLVDGQVVNMPSGQICQMGIKREIACARPN